MAHKTVYQSWDEVDEWLGNLAQLYVELNKKTSKQKAQIAKVKAEFDLETNDIDFQIRQIERNIEEYTRANMDDIRATGKKSMEFNNGTIKTKGIDERNWKFHQ